MQKALFLDRDGVINEDRNYTYRVEDIKFEPHIFELCQHAIELYYRIIIVTNQSGIGRGYYSEAQFQTLTSWLTERFAEKNIAISGVYFCPHHKDATLPQYRIMCQCRKPMPGMFQQATKEHELDVARSLMIGDRETDMLAAKRSGVTTRLFYCPSAPPELKSNATAHISSLRQALDYM